MKFAYLIVFIILFSSVGFAFPHYVSVYTHGKTSLLPPEEIPVDYSIRNKYDVLYHISEGYNISDNCRIRFLKSGFGDSTMEYYGRSCNVQSNEKTIQKDRLFDVQLIYEQNDIKSIY